MRWIHGAGAILFFAVALAGCQPASQQAVELPPPEAFTWTSGQPISFSPPPENWRRSRYQNGGAEGVDFVRVGSKGEMIFVAERFFLGNRDRCARMQTLLEDLVDYSPATFIHDLKDSRLYASKPFNAHEARAVELVNEALDRARKAYLADDMASAQVELGRALEQAGTIRYTVQETVNRVLFTAEGNSVFPALHVDAPMNGELAGEPAIIVNFTFEGHGIPMIGRRIYVVENNRMFEIGYQGLQENLPLFERIVGAMTFPPGRCEH